MAAKSKMTESKANDTPLPISPSPSKIERSKKGWVKGKFSLKNRKKGSKNDSKKSSDSDNTKNSKADKDNNAVGHEQQKKRFLVGDADSTVASEEASSDKEVFSAAVVATAVSATATPTSARGPSR